MLALVLLLCVMSGCVSGYRVHYHQIAPKSFPPSKMVQVCGYKNADLASLHSELFHDWLLIGRSAFNGQYEKPQQLKVFAQSIGADAVLYSVHFTETESVTTQITVPDVRTTDISGSYGGERFSATASSIGVREIPFTYRVDRFDQEAIFLKNVNASPWIGDPARYPRTGSSSFWSSEKYRMEVYESTTNVVGLLAATLAKASARARNGVLKFVFSPATGDGIYMMLDGFPVKGRFQTNAFGHLEIKMPDRTVSFEREK